MDYRFRNLAFANAAVLATSFLAFIQNPATGYLLVCLVLLTDLVLLLRFLWGRRPAPSRTRKPAPVLQVDIDRARCVGQGNCLTVAPEAFVLDKEHKAELADKHAAPSLLLDAARACPVDAIFLHDQRGKQVYPDPMRPWQKKGARQAS
jgi:ferredoxin